MVYNANTISSTDPIYLIPRHSSRPVEPSNPPRSEVRPKIWIGST